MTDLPSQWALAHMVSPPISSGQKADQKKKKK